MPKMKSNRAATKRIKVTAGGKLKREKAFRSHILTSKSKKRKRHLRKSGLVSASQAKSIARLIQA